MINYENNKYDQNARNENRDEVSIFPLLKNDPIKPIPGGIDTCNSIGENCDPGISFNYARQ